MTLADFERYTVQVGKALEGTYFGRKVYTTHAPTSGPVIVQMMNLMEHYEALREDGMTGVNVHRFVEALKCRSLCRSTEIKHSSLINHSSRLRLSVSI